MEDDDCAAATSTETAKFATAMRIHQQEIKRTRTDELDEPATYLQAVASKESGNCEKATKEKINSLVIKGAWIVWKCADELNVIDTRWIFRKKTNDHGEVIRYIATLVANGVHKNKASIIRN